MGGLFGIGGGGQQLPEMRKMPTPASAIETRKGAGESLAAAERARRRLAGGGRRSTILGGGMGGGGGYTPGATGQATLLGGGANA